MANALSLEEFRRFAREQIDTADAILAGDHRPVDASWCLCGRTRPCPDAVLIGQRREYFQGRLALLERTGPPPCQRPAGGARPISAPRQAPRARSPHDYTFDPC